MDPIGNDLSATVISASPLSVQNEKHQYFPSLAAALREIMKKNPSVISFGEIHNLIGLPRSTSEVFAAEILSLLAKHGLSDIVLEFIPDDPGIEGELNYFLKHGRLNDENTPNLSYFIKPEQPSMFYDRPGYLRLIRRAHKLGIEIHGGNLNFKEIDIYYRGLDFSAEERMTHEVMKLRRKRRKEFASPAIKRHTLERVLSLLSKKEKKGLIATYNGVGHNDLSPKCDKEIAFGKDLKERLGNKYIEVDLLLKNLMRGKRTCPATQSDFKHWRKLAPKRGVVLIQPEPNHYVIVIPK